MKIGLSSAAYYGQLETDDAAAHIAELPLDTCEVFLETPSEYTTDFTFRMRYNMNNFPVTSVHPLGTQFEPQLFGRAARQSDDAFAMFANVCRAAESLGAAYYIFHGPFGVRGHLSPANIPFLEERFDQMRERAARHHLRVLWESVSWCSVATPEDVRLLLKRIPDVEFVLDTKQVHQAGVDPLDMLRAMRGHVRHLHVLENEANEMGIKNGDIIKVSCGGEGRKLIFDDVVVRVNKDGATTMHIDTDESQAAANPTVGEIFR